MTVNQVNIYSNVLSKHATLLHLDKGYEYWRRALHLRMTEMDDGSRPYLLKTLFKLKNAERAVEWTTAEELKRVIQHPTEHAIQSTLVRLRIMSDKSCWAAAQTLFKDFFSHGSCPKKLKMQQRFIELLNFLWSLLEMIRRFDPHQTGVWSITVQIVETLVITLKNILLVNPQYLDLETIKTTLKLVVETDQVKFTDTDRIATNRGSHMGELLKLVKLLAALPPNITQNEDVKRYLFELVHTERRDERGRTLLHKACTDFSKDDAHLIVGTVRLILLAGANPNAGDADGNGPLHALALDCYIKREFIDATARLLLDFGAHFDRINKHGQTGADVWIQRAGRKLQWNRGHDRKSVIWDDRPSWCRNGVPKLLCLNAKIIRSHRIPYDKLPLNLKKFVEMH